MRCGLAKLLLSEFRRAGSTKKGTERRYAYCRTCEADELRAGRRKALDAKLAAASSDEHLARLFALTKTGPLGLQALCDKLDLAPGRVAKLLKRAAAEGFPVDVIDSTIIANLPRSRTDVRESGIAPTVGTRQSIAVISDLHYGSKYCLRGAIKEFVAYVYAAGVREIVVPGDMVDGSYRHAQFEMTHMGLSNQARDMCKNLPQYDGLTYHCITGNHDWTFTETSGVNVGQFLENTFHEAGRRDLFAYGDRGAFLRLRGALLYLWHPGGSSSYAKSYRLQKRIEAFQPGEKPQILLTGHFHQFCYVFDRGIHALLCPTFQGGGSAFGRMLGGAVALGGLTLSWQATASGTLRDFSVAYRSYYEHEPAVDAAGVVAGDAHDVVLARAPQRTKRAPRNDT